MKQLSTSLLLGVLAALWMVPLPPAPAQAPTEEDLKELERQAEALEKKQAATKAEAKRKAEAAKKAAAAAEAKREAARKRAEEEHRAADEARSATHKASALAGEFVDIPGGTFQMGCSPGDGGCEEDERPVHTVSMKPFRMGRYEVTVGQFREFVEAAAYRTDAEHGDGCLALHADGQWMGQAGRDWRNPGFPQTDRHPVVCVSWNDAEAYARWLSRQGIGRYRLPSESEWEYAARAGSSPLYRFDTIKMVFTQEYAARDGGSGPYSFGGSEGMLCQYGNVGDGTAKQRYNNWTVAPCDDGALYTAAVGGYRPNGFELNDMHGNVWEWTEDCYHESYTGAPSEGVAWTAGDCARRVFRGGSWSSASWFSRSSSRHGYASDTRHADIGFRLLQDR